MLDTWDAAIVGRFDAIRSSQPVEQAACTLTVSRDCLLYLDHTLNALRKRAQHRGAYSAASGSELTALRSAAVEVAASAYIDGVRRRQRQEADVNVGDAASEPSDRSATMASGLAQRSEAHRRGDLTTITCLLSPTLLTNLDDVLGQRLPEHVELAHRPRAPVDGIDDLRSVVVESAVMAWLLLRGYSTAVPRARRRSGWLKSVRYLVARRWNRAD